jgi:hypothetical protein
VRPFLSANFGGVYGGGFQDGIIFGPEAGFNLNLIEAVDMRLKMAYDFQARELGRWHPLDRPGLRLRVLSAVCSSGPKTARCGGVLPT